MNEIRLSALVEEIIECSKKVTGRYVSILTAERYFIALIDKVNQYDIDELIGGLDDAAFLLKIRISDFSVARKKLLDYVKKNKNQATDEKYMNKRIQEAKEKVRELPYPVVSAELLLRCILETPSIPIKNVLDIEATMPEEMEEDDELYFDMLFEEVEDLEVLEDVKTQMATLVGDVKRIRTNLRDKILGQDHAITVFSTGYFQANLLSMIDQTKERPKATFLFAGPPGVGKTFFAEEVAKELNLPFKRFDMSEYADKEANLEFCGSDKVYKDGHVGNVTGFVAKNPKCVLLFDEIEKAHMCVIYLFLQMLDAGRLRDNYTDKEVSFKNAIIIMTTNAGKQLYEESESGNLSTVSRKVVMKALQQDMNPITNEPYFPAALCSRFASGNVVMFNHIGANHLRAIAKKEIQRHAQNLGVETGIALEIDDRVYTALLFAEGSSVDARTIRSRAEMFFNDELYELLRLIASEKVKTEIHQIEKIKIGMDFSNTSQEIKNLFTKEEKMRILVFAENRVVNNCANQLPLFDVVGAKTVAEATELLKKQQFDFSLIDMQCGANVTMQPILNVEDLASAGREFLKFLLENKKGMPIYLLQDEMSKMSEEEEISFLHMGVRAVLSLGEDCFVTKVNEIAFSLYQQANMVQLAKENKLVSFETAQSISEDGTEATIKLFDFKTGVAVDAADAKNILSAVSKPEITFADVIGAREAKKELAYFVAYLKDPKQYIGTGVKAPRGMLLYGPPGTGKTMLAKAMACEAGVTFIAAEGNQFLKSYVGTGAEQVHQLFKTARKYAPSVLFIDEIDAIGKERTAGDEHHTADVLTAFLAEMDGFKNDPGRPVFVLAATNFDGKPGSAKSLDSALLRRFDRSIYIELPNKEDRIRFLKSKIEKHIALEISDKQVEYIAIRSTGMSLAELDSVVELALRSAIREGSTKVTDSIFEEAFETFNSGETKKWDVAQLERVARHEAGHAFLCWESGEGPAYLTIVARGQHGGYMQPAEQEGKAIFTKKELLAKIRTALGGRAAELVYYGEEDGVSTGASGDLVSATALAKQIVCSFGMDEQFGLAVVMQLQEEGSLSAEVKLAVNKILTEQMKCALQILSENKEKVDALVNVLMHKNHLNGEEINEILKNI